MAIDIPGDSNYNFQINKYLNINDWDLDGLNDLFIQTGDLRLKLKCLQLYSSKKDDFGQITFNFNPNYSAVLEGETGGFIQNCF